MNWDGLVKGSFLALGSFKDDKDEVSESRVEQLSPGTFFSRGAPSSEPRKEKTPQVEPGYLLLPGPAGGGGVDD